MVQQTGVWNGDLLISTNALTTTPWWTLLRYWSTFMWSALGNVIGFDVGSSPWSSYPSMETGFPQLQLSTWHSCLSILLSYKWFKIGQNVFFTGQSAIWWRPGKEHTPLLSVRMPLLPGILYHSLTVHLSCKMKANHGRGREPALVTLTPQWCW